MDDKEKHKDRHIKVSRKILYTATKTTILTTVSTVSTVTFTIIVILTGIGFIAIPDPIVNSLCLLMMTPYYSDKKWYQRLCWLCMLCCDKRGTNINDSDSDPDKLAENLSDLSSTDVNLPSIDTMSQLRVHGEHIILKYKNIPHVSNNNNNNNDEQEQQQQPAQEMQQRAADVQEEAP